MGVGLRTIKESHDFLDNSIRRFVDHHVPDVGQPYVGGGRHLGPEPLRVPAKYRLLSAATLAKG